MLDRSPLINEPMLAPAKTTLAEADADQHEQVVLDSAGKWNLSARAELSNLLGVKTGAAVEDIIHDALLEPINDLTSNCGKRIRARLVALGYCLVSDENQDSSPAVKQCRTGAEIVELIHAGSLVVDDIEDGSQTRRGKPALHVRYGLPIALNAGNWLYFWPFELIKDLKLSSPTTLLVYEYYHRTLLRAHFGQALDLGSRVDKLLQARVPEVCLATMELKTGALMGFAMALGAAIVGVKQAIISVLDRFGCDLGVALQMYDDLGNVLGIREPSKQYEDLVLYRPSWAWACAAKSTLPNEYDRFVAAVNNLPTADEVDSWIDRHNLIQKMREGARCRLDTAFQRLELGLQAQHVRSSVRGLEELRALAAEVSAAYG
jgi:geranylgeranyl pyrophosphate synthase